MDIKIIKTKIINGQAFAIFDMGKGKVNARTQKRYHIARISDPAGYCPTVVSNRLSYILRKF